MNSALKAVVFDWAGTLAPSDRSMPRKSRAKPLVNGDPSTRGPISNPRRSASARRYFSCGLRFRARGTGIRIAVAVAREWGRIAERRCRHHCRFAGIERDCVLGLHRNAERPRSGCDRFGDGHSCRLQGLHDQAFCARALLNSAHSSRFRSAESLSVRGELVLTGDSQPRRWERIAGPMGPWLRSGAQRLKSNTKSIFSR